MAELLKKKQTTKKELLSHMHYNITSFLPSIYNAILIYGSNFHALY